LFDFRASVLIESEARLFSFLAAFLGRKAGGRLSGFAGEKTLC
jgi:hypothetical protein